MVDSDLAFFALLARKGSLSETALELGLTTSGVSKRLAKLENRLGVRLLNRTTRRVSLTSEGEAYREHGQAILASIADLEQMLRKAGERPQGLLRINSTFGFGREYIAPIVSEFARLHPEISAQLVLTDAPINLVEAGYDIAIRFGSPPNSRLIGRRLLRNRRYLCAAPSYIERHGEPHRLRDLADHECIVLRQDNQTYDVWRLQRNQATESIKVQGRLSSNDGEIALRWVLEGHGIMLRSEWDIRRHIEAGRLSIVLPRYAQIDADIYGVYPERDNVSAKIRAFMTFVSDRLRSLGGSDSDLLEA
ncbi:LysR family transcriptional regulator [Aurantimonas sp. MSK8Z-1]|uniref:LysR family transcriptional regulator n=1 Tax=Mangrovibrevibacter kandeliae TaxID=2968473 RepID=UPI002117B388|nr:LysR family transcriptional regulator [Aurantimonas sp. MSK8Z-1]MCW4113977.1 LysR family transcriptional regulator [Aurantimonas sp. MSK8Z-1]